MGDKTIDSRDESRDETLVSRDGGNLLLSGTAFRMEIVQCFNCWENVINEDIYIIIAMTVKTIPCVSV